MSRLALPPEIPAKLARNTLYDVLCIGDSFGIDWTVFEAGISDQAKEAQARALEDGMQFSPNSKDVLRKTELAERKRKLAAARTLNLEGAPGPSVQFSIDSVLSRLRLAEDADVRAMHAALNMTEENFDTPSKPKPGRDADARRLFAAQRLRLLMGAEFYFNRMAEAAGHLLWLLVLSSDPAYKPEMLAKGIMGIEVRCIKQNSRDFITRHESSAVWGERPDTGVLTDAYAIRIVLEAACRTCRDRHGRQGICAFDLVPEFEVPGVTIGDRVQVIRRCSMPDSHGRPMIHGAVKYVVPRRTLALAFFVPVFDKAAAAAAAAPPPRPMLAATESSDSGSDSEEERDAEAAAAARALDFTEEELERARSLPRAGREMTAVFKAAIGEATASASGDGAGAKGKGKGKVAYINLKFEKEDVPAPAARRDLGEQMEAAAPRRPARAGRCALPTQNSEPWAFRHRKGMTLPTEEELEAEREMEEEAALAAAADAKAARELEVAEEYAMELEREREREGEADAELAAAAARRRGHLRARAPVDEFYPLPPSPPSSTPRRRPWRSSRTTSPATLAPGRPSSPPAAARPRAPASPAASDVSWRPSGNPSAFRDFSPVRLSQVPPPARMPLRPLRPSGPSGPSGRPRRAPLPPGPAAQGARAAGAAAAAAGGGAEEDYDEGLETASDDEPPRANKLEVARAELAATVIPAPVINTRRYERVTTHKDDNMARKKAAIQDSLRAWISASGIARRRPMAPGEDPVFMQKLPGCFVYEKVTATQFEGNGTMDEVISKLAMAFHAAYGDKPELFEFTFSKEVLTGEIRRFVEKSLLLHDVCPEMPVIPGHPFACDSHFVVRTPQDKNGDACVLIMAHEVAEKRYKGYMNTCYIQGRLPDGIEEAAANVDFPRVLSMLIDHMPKCAQHLADNGYVTPDEIGYAAAVLYAFNTVGPWHFCDKPLQYCGVIKGQSGTGKSTVTGIMNECYAPGQICVYRPSRGSAFSEHGGEEALCMIMAEGLDLKACTEEELKMRSGDAYARNFKFAKGSDRRCKPLRKTLVIVCNGFPQLANRMLEFFSRIVLITLDHKPLKKRTHLQADIRENELPALNVVAYTYAWKIIHALSDGEATCIQAFEPVWLREKRLAFWQETASCSLTRFIITHCVVDPTTYLVGSETEGGMTSVAGICEYVSRTEGPDASAALAADIENGALDETIAAFGPSAASSPTRPAASGRPTSAASSQGPALLGASQPALQAIRFTLPADPEIGPFPVKASTRGKGKRARNSAPGFVPPPPFAPAAPAQQPAGQQHAGQQRIDEMLPRQGEGASPAGSFRSSPVDGGAGPSGYGSSGSRSASGSRARSASAAPSSSAGPSPVPSPSPTAAPSRRLRRARPRPGAVLSAIQGFGAQQEAERQALAARQAREAEERRQGLWAQRLQRTLAFRAELEAGFRAGQISGAEASERWRAFEAETAGLSKGLGYSYRRVPVPKDYASAAALEASRAEIDAAEMQAEREEAEDNARFRHLHH
eukprot:tig00021137_g18995.t1